MSPSSPATYTRVTAGDEGIARCSREVRPYSLTQRNGEPRGGRAGGAPLYGLHVPTERAERDRAG